MELLHRRPAVGPHAQALRALYRRNDYAVRPVVEAILHASAALPRAQPRQAPRCPDRRDAQGARARYRHRVLDLDLRPGRDAALRPPNVAGWDETRWLDTSTFRGRWTAATRILRDEAIDPDDDYPKGETPTRRIAQALAYWGNPALSDATRAELVGFCQRVEAAATHEWQQDYFRALRQNALRMLIATPPT